MVGAAFISDISDVIASIDELDDQTAFQAVLSVQLRIERAHGQRLIDVEEAKGLLLALGKRSKRLFNA